MEHEADSPVNIRRKKTFTILTLFYTAQSRANEFNNLLNRVRNTLEGGRIDTHLLRKQNQAKRDKKRNFYDTFDGSR